MGVDLQTYRAKIGTFRHSVGLDVITIVCCVNFSGGLKSVGTVLFIGLLLLIAGIEPNPGPKEDDEGKQTISHSSAVKVTGLPENMDEDLLRMVFVNKIGAIRNISFDQSSLSAVIEFLESNDVETALSKGPISILGKVLSIERSLASASGPDKTEMITMIIQKLGVNDYAERKLTLRDVLTIDACDGENDDKKKNMLKDLPMLLIKQLLSANSASLDLRLYNLQCIQSEQKSLSSTGSVSALYDNEEDDESISPLDVFLLSFQCCNPEVKQLIVQKLYFCKLAVPFIYLDCFSKRTVVSVWPLRTIVIENTVRPNGNEILTSEIEVLDMPTHVITFCRYGRPPFSKSKFLNGFVCEFQGETFFNRECNLGMSSRYVTDGYAEMFWLPSGGDETSIFSKPMTFVNLRGDTSCHFFENQLHFISSISDIVVMFVSAGDILSSQEYLESFLSIFKSVMLVICNPLDPKNEYIRTSLNKFESTMKEKFGKRWQTVCTYRKKEEKNAKDLRDEISRILADCLQSNDYESDSFQNRINKFRTESCKIGIGVEKENIKLFGQQTDFSLETDEGEICIYARDKAHQILRAMMKKSPEHWTSSVTPAQFTHAKSLGKLLKEQYSDKKKRDCVEIQTDIINVKILQTNEVSNIVLKFINCLVKFKDKQEDLHYFLTWLKLFVTREQRSTLVELHKENKSRWNQYTRVKNEAQANRGDIKSLGDKIKESESKLEDASFGIECFFREIAYLYDAFICLNINPKSKDFPDVDVMANIAAHMFISGHTFELLDGNSLYMTMTWTSKVFEVVHETINRKKVLALSVLGLQSSGKSTLLNTMFGVQFKASCGRCTRGIHAQLVSLKFNSTFSLENETGSDNKVKQQSGILKQYEFILVIDTEGLRAPELKDTCYKRDNELATIITGLGDITIMNVMGENTSEIRDIIQTIVHAFLRLKIANKKIDIKKRCIFVHQNVAEASASEKMNAGLNRSIELLDDVTRESAESEGISNIKTFDQVIRFSTEKDVWFLPNLWNGNPPLAQTNRKYIKDVVQLNRDLLTRALKSTDKSYKSLQDVVMQTNDLWKGVLSENFVFSYRNSIEKKAFVLVETKLKQMCHDIETPVDEKLITLYGDVVFKCDTTEKLNGAKTLIENEMQSFIKTTKVKVLKSIDEFFEENDYKETAIQWKENATSHILSFANNILKVKEPEINDFIKRQKCHILTHSQNISHEDELRKNSIILAGRLGGQNLNESQIDDAFKGIWDNFVDGIMNSLKSEPSDKKPSLRLMFLKRLETEFENRPLLRTVLEGYNMLQVEKNDIPATLIGSANKTGIVEGDLILKHKIGSSDSDVTMTIEEAFQTAMNDLELAFTDADLKIKKLNQLDHEIMESHIGTFIYEVRTVLDNNLKTSEDIFSVLVSFHIKALVFLSNVALFSFETHNKRYLANHGVNAELEGYKVRCRKRFIMQLQNRTKEETAGNTFRDAIVKNTRDKIKQSMTNNATEELQNHCFPSSKHRLIVKMLTELSYLNNFDLFMQYIKNPKSYSEQWITRTSKDFLFSKKPNQKNRYEVMANAEIKKYTVYFKNQIESTKSNTIENIIKDWLEYNKGVKPDYKIPPDLFDDVIKDFGKDTPVDFTRLMLVFEREIESAKEVLCKEFGEITESSVTWRNSNPYDDIFNKLWGCDGKCMFCGEPCKNSFTCKDNVKHECLQHRPAGVRGIHRIQSREIVITTCNYIVAGDTKGTCGVFKYACNTPHKKDCVLGLHYLRDYKQYFSEWNIDPIHDMEETSKFWYWFIFKYRNELAGKYNIKVTNVPDRWKDITQTNATDSLDIMYKLINKNQN